VGTPPPIQAKKKSKEGERDEKTSSLPFNSSPPPTKPHRSRIPRPKSKRARTPLDPRRARNDYDERIPTLSKEWERTSNRDLMRRKRRREGQRRTPSARTAGSRRERKARVVRFDPRERHAPSGISCGPPLDPRVGFPTPETPALLDLPTPQKKRAERPVQTPQKK